MQLQAQWDTPLSHYWTVKEYYNPAFTAEKEQIETAALYRYQWAGVDDAPQRVLLTINRPFEFLQRRHGGGVVAYTENIGSLRNSLLAVQYSFRKELGKGFLSTGLQAGVYNLNYDAGTVQILTDSLQDSRKRVKADPADSRLFDLNAGISWSGKQAFIGLSAMHINKPGFYKQTIPDNTNSSAGQPDLSDDLQPDSIRSHIPRFYNFMAGCNIVLFHPLEIQPMVRVQSDLSVTNVQATLRMEYNKKFSGGVSWQSDDGYLFFAGTAFQGLTLGYAYNIHTMGMGKESKGSHELYLRYDIPLNYHKPKRQPHKSIRFL